MADFPPPTMVAREDSKYRSEKQIDPVMRSETDGGYVITRPRYTRAPRKVFTTGFTGVTQADKAAFQTFYDARRGGSQQFSWDDPITGTEYIVRFLGEPEFKYVGMRTTYLWDITNIQLEQV